MSNIKMLPKSKTMSFLENFTDSDLENLAVNKVLSNDFEKLWITRIKWCQ